MIALPIIVLGSLQVQAANPGVQVWVGLYNPPPDAAASLRKWLGKGYGVRELTDGQIIGRLKSSQAMRDDSKRQVSIYFPPPVDREHIDRFVPAVEAKLNLLTALGGSVYLCVPVGSSDFLRDYVVPLSRQAAGESGVKQIDLNSGDSFAEAAAETVLDPRLEKKGWRLVSFDSQQIDEGPAANAIDGNPDTYWHTMYDPSAPKPPHETVVDLGQVQSISAFRYLPRQDGGTNGRVRAFTFSTSLDGRNWTEVARGDLPNTPESSRVKFERGPVEARYFKFGARSEQNGGPWASAAEIDVLRSPRTGG